MNCHNCNSSRIVYVQAKASDLFSVSLDEKCKDGYLPYDLGIGGGDYLEMKYCLNCGQIQGNFPLKRTELEDLEMPEWVITNIRKSRYFWGEVSRTWTTAYGYALKLTNSEKEETDLPKDGQFVRIADL